jgi:hypothetical protein
MGLNCELLVNPKLVVPEKINVAPVFSLVSMRALLAGAWISERVIDMHAATAGEICEYAVQRHGVAVVVATVVFDSSVETRDEVLITWKISE